MKCSSKRSVAWARYLERRGALEADDGDAGDDASGGQLEASAVSGQVPPAGPQWLRGLRALEPRGLAYDKLLCALLDGFTLHAATRAGALDTAGREALLRYVLRPPVAQERVVPQKDGLIAITLKRGVMSIGPFLTPTAGLLFYALRRTSPSSAAPNCSAAHELFIAREEPSGLYFERNICSTQQPDRGPAKDGTDGEVDDGTFLVNSRENEDYVASWYVRYA